MRAPRSGMLTKSCRTPYLIAFGLAITQACMPLAGPDYSNRTLPSNRPTDSVPPTFTIAVIEGQSQLVPEGTYLPAVVRLLVLDQFQLPRGGVRVHAQVTSGGGELADSTAVTDRDGYALLPSWRVGEAQRPQRVRVRVGSATVDVRATSHLERLGVPSGRMLLRRGAELMEWHAGAPQPASVATIPNGYWLAAVSPNDSLLAVVNHETPSEICVVSVGTDRRGCINDGIRYPFPYRPTGFAWSPDGRQLVFGAQRGESDICPFDCPPLYSVRAMELAPLRYRWQFDYWTTFPVAAAWSPDGRLLAHMHGDTVRVTDASGANPRDIARLGTAMYATSLRWSPDGRRLAMTLHLSDSLPEVGVGVLDVATGALTVLARMEVGFSGGANSLAWSRHGETLAFGWSSGTDDACNHVFTVPASGGAIVRVVRDLALVDWR